MKRKTCSRVMGLLLAFSLILSTIVPTTLAATTTTVEGVTYTLNTSKKTASVSKTVAGEFATELIIPASIVYNNSTYKVTGIDKQAFRSNDDIVSVVFPDTITTVNQDVFYYCDNLKTVVLPAKLTAIPKNMFYSCPSLETVIIPSTVTTINLSAFYNDAALEQIQLPEGLTTLSYGKVFSGTGLRSIVIPAKVTAIGDYMFSSCANLKDVYIEAPLTKIGAYMFSGSGLEQFVIPETVTSIGAFAFNKCYDLKSLYIACDFPASAPSDSILTDLGTTTVYLSSKYADNWKPFFDKYYSLNVEVIDESEIPAPVKPAAPESYAVKAITSNATVNGVPDTVANGGSYTFTVTPDTACGITSVTVNGIAVTPDESGTYTIENVSDTQVIAVTASAVKHTVKVTGNARILVGTTSTASYTQWVEGTDLTFSVTPTLGYKVTDVTAEGGTLTANDDGTYTLSAPYTDTTISVATEKLDGCVVRFSGNATAYVDGKAVDEVLVAEGGSVSFTLEPNEHLMVTTVMFIAGGPPKRVSATDGVYTLSNVTKSGSVNIMTTSAAYGVAVVCGEHVSSTPATGSFKYGSTFSFALSFDEGYELDTITASSGKLDYGTTSGAYVLSGAEEATTINVTAKPMEPVELTDSQKLLTFKYNANGTAAVSKCPTDFEGEMVVPAVVQNGSYTYRVTEIGASAFSGCAGLTKLTLPEGITTLGNYALQNCTKLTSVELPGTVTTLGNYVFRGNVALTEVKLPASATTLGTNIFNGCEALTNVTLPEGLTTLPTYMFYNCHALTEIKLPSTLTEIDSYAFAATSLKEIVLPEGLVNLGGKESGGRVFQNCYALEKVTLPTTLKIIRKDAFYNCESLEEIHFPEGLEYLGEAALSGCSRLTEVTIPNSITEIKNSLFALCSSLKSVTMSDEITEIGMTAFSRCEALETLKLPAKLEKLSPNAFQVCTGLKSITFPAGLKSIGVQCFSSCTALASVTFEGNQLTLIDAEAFANAKSLTGITLPESLVVLGSNAFYGSGLTSLHIPANVRTSSNTNQTLLQNPAAYCRSLTEITVDESNAYYKGVDGVLLTKKGNMLIQYPAGKTDATYAVPDGVRSINVSAFGGATNLTRVTLPASVTFLAGSAFYGCTNITAFEVPATVQTLNYRSIICGTELIDDLGNSTYITSLEAVVFHGDYNASSMKNTLFFNLDQITVYYPAGNTTWEENLEAAQALYSNVHFVPYDEATQNPMNVHTVTFKTDGHINAMTVAEEPAVVTEASVREMNSYSFTVSPLTGYAVASVKAGDTDLTPDENGIYTVSPTADTEITLTAVEAYYNVQFVSADGLAKIYNGKSEVTGRTTRLQYGYSLTLTVVPDEHYEIAKAALSVGTLTDNGNGSYTISDVSADSVFSVTMQEKHEHTYELTGHKDATCLENGYDRYTCPGCGDTYDDVIEALGHDYKVSEHKDATCTEAGYDRYTCTRCADSYDEPIEAIGHAYELTDHKDATCTEAGYDRYTCKNCADTYDDAIEALGHDYKVTERVEPSNDKAGYEIKTCTRCNDTVRTELAAAECPSASFTDVGENDWFHSVVDYAVANGLMNGVSATSFDPYGAATRAMLVTILHRSAGKPEPTKAVPFTDVRAGAWYANAVAWAYGAKVVNGTSATEFTPDADITREQVAAILYRYAAQKGEDTSARAELDKQFDDAASISSYAADAMSWAVASGILNGDGKSLNPQDSATRAELAAMLVRYLSK